ncbi:GntR family transcriptional regulator [Massilia glaciei]|uniref:GntR family transcriptional regulator n=1 Tax=Massilia glaciei TaxID=1524097 RepID=A0A2U2HIE6_9BURK|nr:GntR family transcriptional regulator [Massilia glaciei]PWF46140.1 GntR family transcriptional regulator [Massilia glaciei]
MEMTVDVAGVEPVYEQIVRQVRQGVLQGALRDGMPIPTIRQLAHDLDLNPNTVAKAYKILETDRVILTAGKKGTFINRDALAHIHTLNRQQAAYAMASLVGSLRERGLSETDIGAAFAAAVAKPEQQGEKDD